MTLLILAAGLGSRYGGLKQIDNLGPNGETILEYSIYDAIQAGFTKVVFVLRSEIVYDFKSLIISKIKGKIEVEIVVQDVKKVPAGIKIGARTKPWGTAHAILMAKAVINEPFLSINADDFYGRNSFKKAANFLSDTNQDEFNYCNIAYPLKVTLSDFGAVARATMEIKNDKLVGTSEFPIIEKRNTGAVFKDKSGAYHKLDADQLISMNMWGLKPSIFAFIESIFISFLLEHSGDLKTEFYIPNVINKLVNTGHIEVSVLDSQSKWFGVTYSNDKISVGKELLNLHSIGQYPKKLWE